MSGRGSQFCVIVLFGLWLGHPILAQAQQSAIRQQPAMSGAQLEKFCEEERHFTEPWIRWASENRSICLMQTKSPSERAACLETVKQQLTAHHQEHRAILMQNIGTLGPNHPVMQSILGRLRERERFASMAIDNDHEPTYLATVRKESCLSQR